MGKIIETLFGTMADPGKIAVGCASQIIKSGPFYNFSIRVESNDIREYSFTNLTRAQNMRNILIGHLEEKLKKNLKAGDHRENNEVR
jgi:hypothetical protein